MKKNIIYAVFTLLSAIIIGGCSSKRETITSPGVTHDTPMTDSHLIHKLINESRDWDNVSLSAKLAVTSPQQVGVSARVTMIRDRNIDISVRMLGFEVAYILVEADSVHAYVKPNKKYMSESLSRIFGSDSYTLSNLQDLITGRIFYPGEKSISSRVESDFGFENLNDMAIVTPRRQPSGAEIGFIIDRTTSQLYSTAISAGNHEALADYSKITDTPAGRLPQVTDISVDNGKIGGTLTWDYNGARWNVKNVSQRRWSVPAGATRITLNASLLNNILGGR